MSAHLRSTLCLLCVCSASCCVSWPAPRVCGLSHCHLTYAPANISLSLLCSPRVHMLECLLRAGSFTVGLSAIIHSPTFFCTYPANGSLTRALGMPSKAPTYGISSPRSMIAADGASVAHDPVLSCRLRCFGVGFMSADIARRCLQKCEQCVGHLAAFDVATVNTFPPTSSIAPTYNCASWAPYRKRVQQSICCGSQVRMPATRRVRPSQVPTTEMTRR